MVGIDSFIHPDLWGTRTKSGSSYMREKSGNDEKIPLPIFLVKLNRPHTTDFPQKVAEEGKVPYFREI